VLSFRAPIDREKAAPLGFGLRQVKRRPQLRQLADGKGEALASRDDLALGAVGLRHMHAHVDEVGPLELAQVTWMISRLFLGKAAIGSGDDIGRPPVLAARKRRFANAARCNGRGEETANVVPSIDPLAGRDRFTGGRCSRRRSRT
jgi:hypothetical protein